MVACSEVNSPGRGRRHESLYGKEAVSAQLKAMHSMGEDYCMAVTRLPGAGHLFVGRIKKADEAHRGSGGLSSSPHRVIYFGDVEISFTQGDAMISACDWPRTHFWWKYFPASSTPASSTVQCAYPTSLPPILALGVHIISLSSYIAFLAFPNSCNPSPPPKPRDNIHLRLEMKP